jgi:ADP-ribose pyrophosphatase
MDDIKRIKREFIRNGNVIDFYEDTMQFPDGSTAKWDFIEHKGAAAVVPVLSDGRIVMVRQYRNAIESETIEIPAGSLDYRGEPSVTAAGRELTEETGYKAETLEYLITVNTAIAFCNEKIDIYVATGLKPGAQHLDEDEYVNVEIYTLDELCHMIYAGEITDNKTISSLLAYKEKYR